MRLFVTGVSGFVGRRLARALVARGDEVSGSYAGDRPQLDGVEAHEVEITDSERFAELFERYRSEAVIHLAGLSHVGASWNDLPGYFRVNVLGTEAVVRAAGERRVVLASSAEVYGAVPEDEQPIPEERPLAPASPYALTKAAAERLVLAGGGVVARSFNLAGPGQSQSFALPAFARQLASIAAGQHEAVLRVGNLSARRDFVHVDDGVEALRLLATVAERGRAYNISAGRAVSIADALDRLMGVSGVSARIETDPERMRPVDIPLTTGDPARLEALGWRRERDLDRALADLWASVSSD